MTTLRWPMILLAAGTAAAGLLYAMRETADVPPATAAAPTLPTAPPDQPTSPPVVTTAASTAPPVALPARVAAAAPARAPIGAEGYGPHIERAQAGNDAQAAWDAVQWLRNCASTEARRNSFENVRNQGVAPDMMTQLMVEADAEARRCQTVTAQHRALLPELAARAMRAGVPEAASAYASNVFPADLTPAQREEVADAMRRDARAGDAMSLLGAVLSHEAWGLSDTERQAYLLAYGSLPGHPEAQGLIKTMTEQGAIRFKQPPTPEQAAAAQLAAQEIVARAGGRL